MSKELKFTDYLDEAWKLKVRLPLLGGMPLNYLGLLFFGVLGFANPGFWFLGLAGEATYLYGLASNKRFQNYVRGMKLLELKETWDEKLNGLYGQLSKKNKLAYDEIERQCEAILATNQYEDLSENIAGQINNLMYIFLKMLLTEERICRTMENSNTDKIRISIKTLEDQIERTKSESITASLQSSLQIQKARLTNIEKSDENLNLTRSEIDRIKFQINLISEEIQLNKTPEQFSSMINGVVQSIQDTSRIVAEASEIYDSIEIQSSNIQMIKH